MPYPKYAARCLQDARELTQDELAQTLEQLLRLPPALQAILDAELSAGNKVVAGVSSGWPDEGSIVIELARRFHTRYKKAGLNYSHTNDPHYWHAEYSTTGKPRHLLIGGW